MDFSPAAVAIVTFIAGIMCISAFHMIEVAVRRAYQSYAAQQRLCDERQSSGDIAQEFQPATMDAE